MTETATPAALARPAAWLGVGGLVLLVVLTGVALAGAARLKLVGIAWVAFAGMAGGALLGSRANAEHAGALVWGYGLASGAMTASSAAFLVPGAVGHHPTIGGFGIAAGILAGFAGHTGGHRLSHRDLPLDRTAAALTAHALAAGLIVGVVYAGMPALGPLLGLAIVSHKGPAGYAAARRLVRNDRPVAGLLVPASALGVAALGVAVLGPVVGAALATPAVRGVVFGFGAGVFLHVAMDFLPRCETGSEVHEVVEVEGHAHEVLDRLRVHAVVSTLLGAVAVFVAWLALAG